MHPVAKQRFESVWDALQIDAEQVRQVVAPVAKHGRAQENEFAAATAAITGENVRSIQRHVARAEALGDDIDRMAGRYAATKQVTGFLSSGAGGYMLATRYKTRY